MSAARLWLARRQVDAWALDLAVEEWTEDHPGQALLVSLVAAVVLASVLLPIAQALQGRLS